MIIRELLKETISPAQKKIYNAITKAVVTVTKWEHSHHDPLSRAHNDYSSKAKKIGEQLKAATLEGPEEFAKVWNKWAAEEPDFWALFAETLFGELGAIPPKHDLDPHADTYDTLFSRLNFVKESSNDHTYNVGDKVMFIDSMRYIDGEKDPEPVTATITKKTYVTINKGTKNEQRAAGYEFDNGDSCLNDDVIRRVKK